MLTLFKNKKLNNETEEKFTEDFEELSDVEFFVNKKKGTVTCKLHNCEDIALCRIYKYTNSTIDWITRPSRYLVDNIYVGVAKCAPDDSFDEEYGKKLALIKAKAKRGKAINNAINKFIKDATKSLERLSENGIHNVPSVKAFLEGEE